MWQVAACFHRFSTLVPGLKEQKKETLTLLGSPIFPDAITATPEAKRKALISISGLLQELSAHGFGCFAPLFFDPKDYLPSQDSSYLAIPC